MKENAIKLWILIKIRCRQPPVSKKNGAIEEEINDEKKPRNEHRITMDIKKCVKIGQL